MTTKRLRDYPSAEELNTLYSEPHDHMRYGRGHGERVDATVVLGKTIPIKYRSTIGDLSCGNAAIALRIAPKNAVLHLGDFAGKVNNPSKGLTLVGPIEDTCENIPNVSTFICSETLEHLNSPLDVLVKIRSKSKYLLLSTPIDAWEDTNDEHLWAWSKEDVEDLLSQSGWEPEKFDSVDSREYGEPYLYGIWVAK